MYSHQKQKTKNTYITPCLNFTLCIKTKNRKQKLNTRLYDRNRKKCKSSLQAQKKNQQPKSKFFTFLFEGTHSVCHFLYFYNLPFAFIHYTFCFNSISMVESSAAFSMRLSESLFKVSCNFSSMTFFDFNSLISLLRPQLFSSLHQKLLSLFFLQGQFFVYCELCELDLSTPWLL